MTQEQIQNALDALNMITNHDTPMPFTDKEWLKILNSRDDLQAAHARYAGGDRKCSECGDDRKGLTLCCMNCLNNDGWSHSEHPVVGYAGGGEAVAYMRADGAVISATQKDRALNNQGTAGAIVARTYNEPLYASNTASRDSEGPDYPDGHDCEGFVGGCERMGCSGKCHPAPAVPDKKPEPEHLPDWDPHNHYVKGWNECRQAMIVASRENK